MVLSVCRISAEPRSRNIHVPAFPALWVCGRARVRGLRRFRDEVGSRERLSAARHGETDMATTIQKITLSASRDIPFNKLVLSQANVRRVKAGVSIEELADKLVPLGLENRDSFVRNIKEYNEAVYAFQKENPGKKWDPAIRDGMSTQSSAKRLLLGKTNWALPVDKAPFLAVAVTCGITFTFGGLKVIPETAQVISSITGKGIPGLYAVGEMLGGLFYENYPGGSGLTSGAVFGRRAGTAAAKAVGTS